MMAITAYTKTVYVNGVAPALNNTNLNNSENQIDALTSGLDTAATADKIILRDASGRAKVIAPSTESDIALKSNVTTVQSNLTTQITTFDAYEEYIVFMTIRDARRLV